MTDAEIEDRINHPKKYDITKIQVLRARGQLPENEQVGPTCGIYALQAAFDIKGNRIAPRKQVFGDWRATGRFRPTDSIRGKVKAMGLSKIGEIGGAADLAALAGGLGIPVTVKRFGSEKELWALIVDAVNAGKGIVMPYACAGNDGAPAWSTGTDGFAHWCLVFGYAEFSTGSPRMFMTTYGNYLEVTSYTALGILSQRGFNVTGPVCVSCWISVVSMEPNMANSLEPIFRKP
jgi:hypothetical protein